MRTTKIILTIVFIMISITNTHSQCRLLNNDWKIVFQEEFNTQVEFENTFNDKWFYEYKNGRVLNLNGAYNYFNTYNKFENIEVQLNLENNDNNGYALFNTYKLIKPINYTPPGGINMDYQYTSAILRSRYSDFPMCAWDSDIGDPDKTTGALYGMFEIRCKLPSVHGQYTAFWLCGNNTWPPEIDVFESHAMDNGYNMDKNAFFSSVHWKNSNLIKETQSNMYYYTKSLAEDFHIYTVVWTPTKITWFLDYREIKSDNILSHILGREDLYQNNVYEICKQAKMDLIIGPSLMYPYHETTNFEPFIVDYIRIYKPQNLDPIDATTSMNNYFINMNNIYANTNYKTIIDWNLNQILSNSAPNNTAIKFTYNKISNRYYIINTDGKVEYLDNDIQHPLLEEQNTFPLIDNNNITQFQDLKFINGILYAQANVNLYRYDFINKKFDALQVNNVNLNNVGGKFSTNNTGDIIVYLNTSNNIVYLLKTNNIWNIYNITNSNNSNNFTYDFTNDILYEVNGNNNLNEYKKRYNSYIWTLNQILTNNNVIGPIVHNDNSLELFYVDNSNNINRLHRTSINSSFQNILISSLYPWDLQNPINVNNAISNTNLVLSYNPTKLYYVGNDYRIWELYNQNNAYYSNTLSWYEYYAADNLIAMDANNSDFKLHFTSPKKEIRTLSYNECEVLEQYNGSNIFLRKNNAIDTINIKIAGNTEQNEVLKIWPNPSGNNINISQLNRNFNQTLSIKVIDPITFQSIEVPVTENNLITTLDLSNLKNGIYFLIINNEPRYYKIIKE